jgi:low affinity Fe/Cu permease
MTRKGKHKGLFTRFSIWVSKLSGSPGAFVVAVAIIVAWAIAGPLVGFGDTWQLVINTGTTIITFLMVFLIQSTQNRDTEAMQIKLDELIRRIDGADEALLDLEELDESALDEIRASYKKRAAAARKHGKISRPAAASQGPGPD